MIKHQILLSSSYSEGTRICLDFPDCDQAVVKDAIDRINMAYDGKAVYFSTHTVHTDSADWSSVVEKDPYFDDVRVIGTVDDFVMMIQKDRYLVGLDVAKYILSKQSCTHTRIQKLTYMCYADYLCKTGDRLFVDNIYAFEHGPVIDSVYQALRDHSKEHPAEPIDSDKMISRMDLLAQIRSRILFAEDGEEKLRSIEETLKKYDPISTDNLVKITHSKQSPWDVTCERAHERHDAHIYLTMEDDDIRTYHHNEGPHPVS